MNRIDFEEGLPKKPRSKIKLFWDTYKKTIAIVSIVILIIIALALGIAFSAPSTNNTVQNTTQVWTSEKTSTSSISVSTPSKTTLTTTKIQTTTTQTLLTTSVESTSHVVTEHLSTTTHSLSSTGSSIKSTTQVVVTELSSTNTQDLQTTKITVGSTTQVFTNPVVTEHSSTTTKALETTTIKVESTTQEITSTMINEKTTTQTPVTEIPDKKDSRVDCLPWLRGDKNADIQKECLKNSNCKYQNLDGNIDIPSCYFDNEKIKLTFERDEDTPLGKSYFITAGDSLNKNTPVKLRIDFEYLDDFALRFKIYRLNEKDYEVPIEINKPNTKAKNPKYEVKIDQSGKSFNFKIIRTSTGTVLWDTSLGPIIFDELNRQISTRLPSEYVYGFGENRHESFKHDLSYQNWPIWGRDEAPENYENGNLYGAQPFYTCMENDGKSHGVVLVNSNALDYEFIPEPGLTYRATGGIFDFYVFMGPEPETVIQQFTQYFGRTFFPPYWALGFQISRYGYLDLEDMKGVLDRFNKHGIPLDTQVADIDHFDKRKDFTIDPVNWANLSDYFDYLHTLGMKTVLLIDPALVVNETDYWPYKTGIENKVFIEWPEGMSPDYNETQSNIMLGYCWPPAKVAYPDFMKKSTQKWWIESILRHHETLKFDGLWIDMNEPAVFGTNEERPFNWPEEAKPYWSLKCPDDENEMVKTKAAYLYGKKLSDKTLCMAGLQGEKNEYSHFDVHNLYGYYESIPTYEAARKINNDKRGFVISRSTFLGSGKYTGHWTGDNHSLWRHLYYSIIGMFEFNLFGIPYVGADICGFWLNATDELCARWSSLGAFYPFSRNHNNEFNIHQDPGSLSEDVVNSAKNALIVRYEILPYYYTLFYKAHTKGNTVVRPLFHEFPLDKHTYSIDKQFLVGPAFMVTPVLEEKVTSVEGYFPPSNWFDYYNGKLVANDQTNGVKLNLDAPIDFIPLHIRGGYIIPTQGWDLTTAKSRSNPFGLIVAPDSDGEAKGDLFYDDGETDLEKENYYQATFFLRDNVLKMYVEHNSYSEMQNKVLNKIRLFVKPGQNIKFILNKNKVLAAENIQLNNDSIVLVKLNLAMTNSFEIEWTTESSIGLNGETIVDCLAENEKDCQSKECIFDSSAVLAPKCRVPKDQGGYTVVNSLSNIYELEKPDNFTLFGDDIQKLLVKVSHGKIRNKFGLTRIKIYDGNNSRYEVPVKLNFDESDQEYLNVKLENSNDLKAYFEVSKDGKKLFDTIGLEHGFAFSNQFIQFMLNLRDYKNLYGFGENTHFSFQHRFSYTNWWGVFGRDQPPGAKTINLYGTHPFFMAVDERTGRAFGCLIQNSNAQEYGLLPPATVAYRTLGGILDFYIMEEASPEALIQAYTSLIGTPYMPPYWSLGFQLSRYGYNSLEKLKAAVSRTVEAKIPLDVQYADIDHFRKQLDFTYDEVAFKGLPEYIKELRDQGIRFIIILDPAINMEERDYKPYENGVAMDIYIKWPEDENPQLNETSDGNNTYMVGYVWPEGKTVFPDFFRPKTQEWWMNEIDLHYKNVLTFDGLWIDMNEPANFDTNFDKPWNWPKNRTEWNLKCPSNTYDDPPYLPLIAKPFGETRRISDKTLCMRGIQGENNEFIHYDVHNLYGWSQTEPTLKALRKTLDKRSIVITRSTYPSSGHYSGHWLGDNTSIWPHLKLNLIGLLEFNLFGIPYIGADICGFFDDATPEMCTRWMQLGAFNTFFRNHNGFNGIDQDPLALGKDVAAASKSVVEIRYSLLPFLYSLFYQVNKNGGTVIRSLMQEFPTDPRAMEIDRQMMWGSSLLISPVLEKNTRSVYAYFPKGRWFDFYTGSEIVGTERIHELDAPLDFIPLHVKGGSIIVTQEPGNNTVFSRQNPFGLIIALNEQIDEFDTTLYYDEGDVIDPTQKATLVHFTYKSENDVQTLTIKATETNYKLLETNKLNKVRIFGVKKEPKSISVGSEVHSEFVYNIITKELTINDLSIKLDTADINEVKINF